jgi:release factor glutamine methyltransferase
MPALEGLTIGELRLQFSEALASYYSSTEAAIIADMLISHQFKLQKHELVIHRDLMIHADQAIELEKGLARLLAREPIQYVLGEVDFCGHRFQIDNRALIPRPETEELVYWTIDFITSNNANNASNKIPTILDFGTGSGCIAIALGLTLPTFQIWGIDKSLDALALAKKNAQHLGASNVHFLAEDMEYLQHSEQLKTFAPIQVIISNPPYVPFEESDTLLPHVRDFEPHQALFTPTHDPLYFYKHIIAFAQSALVPGGCLFFEGHQAFIPTLKDLLIESGFSNVEQRDDLNGLARMVFAQWCP